LWFRLRSPSTDALLEQGVTPDDLAFMRAREDDAHVSDRGVSVFVRGRASRGAVTKRFAWTFRQGYTLHDCGGGEDAGPASAFELRSGDAIRVEIVVHGEELFRASA